MTDLAIATPLGYLADKIGRRLVLALNCLSTAGLLLWIAFVGMKHESCEQARKYSHEFRSDSIDFPESDTRWSISDSVRWRQQRLQVRISGTDE